MTTDAVGGVWEYSLELSRGLASAGVEVVLAVMGPPPDARQRSAASEIAEVIDEPYRLEWMEEPWADVDEAGRWLLQLEADRGCDLVHLGGYAHGAVPFRSPKVVVAHSCVLSWWRAVKGEPAPPSWDRYRAMVRAGLAGADAVVAPTAWMLAALQELHGSIPRGQVIANGRDPGRYSAAVKEPFVLSAGRLWDEAKNAALLAGVACRLPWPVYIAGAADAPAGTRTADFPSSDARLLGRLPPDELAATCGRAAIYASAARYEPFGLGVLEAALCGCALVLADIPSLRELWEDAALFAPALDDDAFARALLTLIEQPATRARLATRSRSRALGLSGARMTSRYLDLYATLLPPASR
jgi:glycogen(starch) synthase